LIPTNGREVGKTLFMVVGHAAASQDAVQ
jgi:hypothetical protein